MVTFKLLQQHGAQVTRRVLHRAVEAAAFAKTPEKRAERMEMVRYLVEECGCDVNGMDVEQWIAGDCWGTPAAYAVHASGAHGEGAAKVVRWLLEVSRCDDCYFIRWVKRTHNHLSWRKLI